MRHCPRLEQSRKLQRVLRYLLQRYPKLSSTLELNAGAPTTRASSDISDLRQNGIPIDGTEGGQTADGMRLHYYRISPSQIAQVRERYARLFPRPVVRLHDAFDGAAQTLFNQL